jgi:hypothetical protein
MTDKLGNRFRTVYNASDGDAMKPKSHDAQANGHSADAAAL